MNPSGDGSETDPALDAPLAPSTDAVSSPARLATRAELPALCAGLPYREQVQPTEPGPHVWGRASELPAGLDFDAATGILSGVPQAAGRLQVEVSSGGREQLLEVTLPLRDSCWFALLTRSSAAAPPQLHVRDVFLTEDIVLGGGEAVRDFSFSPDGAWLAFRTGSAEAQRLYTFALPSEPSGAPVAATPLELGCNGAPSEPAACSVLEYTWSPDSRRLAVALRVSDGQDAIAIAEPAGGAVAPASFTVDWVGTERPLLFGEQLTWGGPDWLGFWGLEAGVPAAESQVFHLVTLAPGGAATLSALLAEFGVGPRLRAVPSGLALAYADSTIITTLSWSAGKELPIALRRTVGVLSPSGRLVATASPEGRLQITDANPTGPAAPVESARDACGAIVAWSAPITAGVERISCTQGNGLRLFDHIPADVPAGVPGAVARLEQEAGTELGAAPDLLATRRMFSAAGRFLLLADASSRQLFLHDLQARSVNELLPFELPAVAEFAPGREALSLANAETLAEYGLPRSLGQQRMYDTFGAGPVLGARCSESYWQDPERWCGSPALASHWRYSPRAHSLLFEGPPGTLSIADVSMMPQRDARTLQGTLEPCVSPCRSASYAFRPSAELTLP